MKCKFTLVAPAIAMLIAFTGCATAPLTESGRAELLNKSADVKATAVATDSGVTEFFQKAAAYAIFSDVSKDTLGFTGAWGRGTFYEDGKVVGYCDFTQGGTGFQMDGQDFYEIIFFETPAAAAKFKAGSFSLPAEAAAVVLKYSAAAHAKYVNGMVVFTMSQTGLTNTVPVGGQKFRFEPVSKAP